MKLNNKLFSPMRAVTRILMGQGPTLATAAIQKVLKAGAAKAAAKPATKAPPMRDINPPPQPSARSAAPPPPPPPQSPQSATPMTDAAELMSRIVPEMMANLDRAAGEGGMAAFKMPNFEMPSFDLAGAMGGGRSPAETLPGKFIDGSHTNAAGTRSYKLYVPSTYTGEQQVPLVVMLHGCTQDPVDFASGTQMNQLAEEMHCLVVYPAQSQSANAQRCWNWFSAVDQTRDQGEPSIIAGITRDVMASHNVDDRQVYVAGLSAGGAMATIMGTLYPDLYAAVGVHSGLPFASAHDLPSALAAMKGKFGQPREQGKSIPIIVFHGDRDTTVHPANGDELIARGKHHAAKEIVVEPGRVPDGHAYTRTVHQHPDGTPHAEQWLIHGAGHAWSGGSSRGSYTDGKGPDASREMMRFFRTKR
ncbi:MAG TPA: PHB depolymerase family esterase [Telluria sp.]|nr:PHB depolymerase family esterase [Telluria sp.]